MTKRNDEAVTIGGQRIELSNLGKVLFPKSGLTKGDLVGYYRRIAEFALPHYRDRPLSMQRFPDGIAEEGFFQKQVPDYFPAWIERVELAKQDGTVTYVIANNAATLVYLANQGCITPHLSLARQDRPDHPDRLIFDLDPSDEDFTKVQDAAEKVGALLDELDLTSFVQTTGSRGLHVVVPLDRSGDFDTVRAFARAVADCLAARHPDALTVEQRKNKRGSRVFLDYLRNAYGQTSVAPYAVRAREGAPVATPLRWDEVGAGDLEARKYTIANLFQRLAQIDDPWAGMARRASSIEAAHGRLAKIARIGTGETVPRPCRECQDSADAYLTDKEGDVTQTYSFTTGGEPADEIGRLGLAPPKPPPEEPPQPIPDSPPQVPDEIPVDEPPGKDREIPLDPPAETPDDVPPETPPPPPAEVVA